MISLLSKVIFSLGIILIVSAIGAIYITMMATQNNANQNSNASTSTNIPPTQQGKSNNIKNNISQSEGVSLKDNTIIISKGSQFPDSKIYYIPSNANIQPNNRIIWKNNDNAVHTATADDGSFDTGIISPGSFKSVTVKGQGTISYHCTIHSWMKGKITIMSIH
jgi:nitrite reductase (NO-forming)